MTLIEDWRHAWRWWSVRLSVLGAVTQILAMLPTQVAIELWNMMPGEVRTLIPPHVATPLAFGFFLAAAAARLVPQRRPDDAR